MNASKNRIILLAVLGFVLVTAVIAFFVSSSDFGTDNIPSAPIYEEDPNTQVQKDETTKIFADNPEGKTSESDNNQNPSGTTNTSEFRYAKDFIGKNNGNLIDKLGTNYRLKPFDGGSCCYSFSGYGDFKLIYPPDDWNLENVERDKYVQYVQVTGDGKIDETLNAGMLYDELSNALDKLTGAKVTEDYYYSKATEESGYYVIIRLPDYSVSFDWQGDYSFYDRRADMVIISLPDTDEGTEAYGEDEPENDFNDAYLGTWSDMNYVSVDISYNGSDYDIRVDWGGTVTEHTVIEMTAYYDSASDALCYDESNYTTYLSTVSSIPATESGAYGSGSFWFSYGDLYWSRSDDAEPIYLVKE